MFSLNTTVITPALNRITGNEVLVSLFLLSPAEAFNYLGLSFLVRMFPAPETLSPEDAAQIDQLKQALRDGKTTLDAPQIVQQEGPVPAGEDDSLLHSLLLQPSDQHHTFSEPAVPTSGSPQSPPSQASPVALPSDRFPVPQACGQQPHFSVIIAETAMQQVLERYVARNFAGVELTKLHNATFDAQVHGKDIRLDLHHGVAEVQVDLHGVFTISAFKKTVTAMEKPISLVIGTGFTVNAARQVCLDISRGTARIIQPTLPANWANKLITTVVKKIPPQPLFLVPSSFPLLDADGNVVEMFALKVTNIEIGEHEARLGLMLVHGNVTPHSESW